MTLHPDVTDPDSELRRLARANVATFPPLTAEQLAEISRLFAGTNGPLPSRGAAAGASGGARSSAAGHPRPVAGPRSSGPRRAQSDAGRDASFPKP